MALRALPAREVLPAAQALAAQIANNSPLSVQDLKRSLALDEAALEQALAREAECQSIGYASEDLGEGLRAAAERRALVFRGR